MKIRRTEGICLDDKVTVNGFTWQKIMQLDQESSGSRAMCAKLRRAVGKAPGDSSDVWELTLQGAPEEWDSKAGKPSCEEWAVHTALTLYALHRQGKTESVNAEGISFASAVGGLARKDGDRLEAVQRRFNAVATSVEFTELAHHARGLVQLLKANDMKMDYPRFAQDLFAFQKPGMTDRVRLRWGEDFYRAINKKNEKGGEND